MNTGIQSEIPCNLCDGRTATQLSARSRSGAALRTLACQACGLVWSDPRPHDPRQFYTEDYRQAYKGQRVPKPKHVLRAGVVALDRLAKIRDLLQAPKQILDVGSGGGEFAYLLTTLGHSVKCVEPNRGYAEYAAQEYGLDIQVGLIGEMPLPTAAYDVITLWHVLEHTADPGAVLQQLRAALRPGGTLVVEVPNVEATCQSPASSFHEAHLYNFNPVTLVALAKKSGLSTVTLSVSPDGGNLTVILGPDPVATSDPDTGWVLPGNHERVAGIVSAHQTSAHWLSAHPYRRLGQKLTRMAWEWWATRTPGSARDRLDRLYAAAQAPKEDPTQSGRSSPPLWLFIAAAYATALLLEWALLDTWLPRGGLSDLQALAVYQVIQVAVVMSVVHLTRKPSDFKQVVRLAAWAGPLFILPAYC